MASSPGDVHRPWLRPGGWVAAALVTVALAFLAARADLAPGGIGPVATVADLAVGLAFVTGAALAPGPWRCPALFAAVGLVWLIGSIVPAAYLAYLGVLVIALATFPSGRPRSARDWILVTLPLVSLVVVPVKTVWAGLFATVAASAWAGQTVGAGRGLVSVRSLGGNRPGARWIVAGRDEPAALIRPSVLATRERAGAARHRHRLPGCELGGHPGAGHARRPAAGRPARRRPRRPRHPASRHAW